jgi:hypothetical protein
MRPSLDSLLELQNFVHGEITEAYKNQTVSALKDLEKNSIGESQFFWSFMKEMGLKVHSDFFKDFQFGDGFQVLDQMGRLTYFSLNIARLLKFDLDHVLQTPFDELFERDPFMTKRIMDSFLKIMASPNHVVHDLTGIPKHEVKQIGFPSDSYYVSFKKAYPVYMNDGTFYGFVLRLDIEKILNH